MRRYLHLVTAILIALTLSAYTVWCYSKGVTPGEHVFHLYSIVMMVLIVAWVISDPALPASRKPSFDYALLLWVSFPFLAAYQMHAARGWRGILVVFGLILLLFAPYLSFRIMELLQ